MIHFSLLALKLLYYFILIKREINNNNNNKNDLNKYMYIYK